MRRNLDIGVRYPGFYRQDIMEWRRRELGWSRRETARRASVNYSTNHDVFQGKAKSDAAWRVANALSLDWSALHNFKLKSSEFHLAVRNGRSGAR